MALWLNETKYDKIINGMALGYGVPAPLIKAIIAKESSFNSQAYKSEPQIKDASRGLMQVLYRTAVSLGYKGMADDLFEPSTNIMYGTRLLADNIQRSVKANIPNPIANAVAAYNAGWSKKFPGWAPRTPQLKYVNQEYVDAVNVYAAYFAGQIPEAEALQFTRSKAWAGGSTLFF